MLKPPSLKWVPAYPVTACIAGMAILVTGWSWWSGRTIDHFFMDYHVWDHWELWRAFTSVLPHANLPHLAFNLYWLWVFGTVVERAFGHVRFFGIVLLLAAGSGLAEFSLFNGGVGLSGVGYGLWAMLAMLQADPRFADTVDAQTNRTFVIWFFLCIVLTAAEIMPVANVAHGVGALVGALVGLSLRGERRWRTIGVIGITAVLALGLLGATVAWHHVNISEYAQAEVERAGLEALEQKRNAHALELLERAAHWKAAPARTWFNLGIAYQRAAQDEKACAAYEHASGMPDADRSMRETANQMKQFLEYRGRKVTK